MGQAQVTDIGLDISLSYLGPRHHSTWNVDSSAKCTRSSQSMDNRGQVKYQKTGTAARSNLDSEHLLLPGLHSAARGSVHTNTILTSTLRHCLILVNPIHSPHHSPSCHLKYTLHPSLRLIIIIPSLLTDAAVVIHSCLRRKPSSLIFIVVFVNHFSPPTSLQSPASGRHLFQPLLLAKITRPAERMQVRTMI